MSIVLIIDEKITMEQLMQSKTVEIQYVTQFNNKTQIRTFPNDYSLEQQAIFSQVYDDAVYSSEIGMHSYKVKRIAQTITTIIKQRTGSNADDLIEVDSTYPMKIKFTRFGINLESKEIETTYGSAFTPEQLTELSELGILISGLSNDFTIDEQTSDIAVQIIKDQYDSYIDMDNFNAGVTMIENTL